MSRPPGRPKGTQKTGGRVAGTPNRVNRLVHEAKLIPPGAYAEVGLSPEVIESITPLQCMLFVMHKALEANNMALAMSCAAVAAPYVHPKLTSSDVRISGELTTKSDAELAAEIVALEAKIIAAQVVN
jgi:hypothetical protein